MGQTKVPGKVVYRCFFAYEPINVDGVLDEPIWQKAEVLRFITPKTYMEPIYKTEARVLYDDSYLYLGFKACDQDIWATYTERDSRLWEEDVLECFFKTDPNKDPYYEFEFSPLGTVFDALIAKRGAAGNIARWTKWDCAGLKVATQVKGTLNDWSDKDEHWTLEVAIPFLALPTLSGGKPGKGDVWLFHLARCEYSVYLLEGHEFTSCAPLSEVNFHLYEDWLRLAFE